MTPIYERKSLIFKIPHYISFLHCIIFLKQCILILVSSIPARRPHGTYQKCLSQASIYAFRSRAEFSYLNLNMTVKVQVPVRSLAWQSLQVISSLLHHPTGNKFDSNVFQITAPILKALDICTKTLVEINLSIWILVALSPWHVMTSPWAFISIHVELSKIASAVDNSLCSCQERQNTACSSCIQLSILLLLHGQLYK